MNHQICQLINIQSIAISIIGLFLMSLFIIIMFKHKKYQTVNNLQSANPIYASLTLKNKNDQKIVDFEKQRNNRLNMYKQKINLNEIKSKLQVLQQKLNQTKNRALSPELYTSQINRNTQQISPTRTDRHYQRQNYRNQQFKLDNSLIKSWEIGKEIKQQNQLFQTNISLNKKAQGLCLKQQSKQQKSLKNLFSNKVLSKSIFINEAQQETVNLAQSLKIDNFFKEKDIEKAFKKANQDEANRNKKDRYLLNINKSMELLKLFQTVKVNNKHDGKAENNNKAMVNEFRVGRMIGKGKFGKVYLAEHMKTKMVVALKKIEKKVVKEWKMERSLIKEIKLHLTLDHPNIVKCYGVFECEDNIYLILQYMSGGSLFSRIKKRGSLQFKEASDYFKDTTKGIKYLHDLQIMHRDLKPQNIVVNEGVAKICDFGFASKVQGMRSTYCGTLQYASPQILSKRMYGLQVDIWSLGILLYEMLLGKAPFHNKNRQGGKEGVLKISSDISYKDEESLTFDLEIPELAKQLICMLLQKDPSKRLTIDELISHKMFEKNHKK